MHTTAKANGWTKAVVSISRSINQTYICLKLTAVPLLINALHQSNSPSRV